VLDDRKLYKQVKAKILDLWRDTNSGEHTHVVGKYYPSDAGKCMRRTFLKYKLNVSTDGKLVAKGRIIMSHVIENMYMDILAQMGYQTKVGVSKSHNGILISGEVDALGKDDVIDVKSVTPTALDKTPFPSDIAQLNTYLWITGRPVGYLLYVKSDNPAIFKIVKVHYSQHMMEKTLERIHRLHYYISNDIIPPKVKDPEVCKRCIFRKICSGIERVQRRSEYEQHHQEAHLDDEQQHQRNTS